MWTVDIDVGGTLTDGLFTGGGQVTSVKVDSTPHDLTVCLMDCLTQGAAQLGFPDTAALLEQVDLIRWSTTITSNVLAEGRGPRIGLLVTRGHERDLYAAGGHDGLLGRLLQAQDVDGLEAQAQESTIMAAAHRLLESGVRRICVSLRGAHAEPAVERRMKRAIGQQYPDHFLGSVPVLAGSDISSSADDATRTRCAVINAYTHGALAATLFKAEDELRDTGRYAGAFLVGHTSGGAAGVAKTKAIDTIESGPVLGIQGSAFLAREYGLRDVVAMDIGGTTAKLSVLRRGEALLRRPSDFFGIPVQVSLPYLRSIALGGGSVLHAGTDAGGGLELGPESMGAYPGPACYGLGGDKATLTDAFVAAGLINPEFFLGGAKQIHADLARQALEQAVAQPLGISLEEAARRAVSRAFERVAGMIAGAQTELGADFSGHTLFAYGGNGGLFACGVAEMAGLRNVRVFSLGPVFSAFGSSVSDICHVYERALPANEITEDTTARARTLLAEARAEAEKDLLGEGIKPEGLSFTVEFEPGGPAGAGAPAVCTPASLESATALQAAIAETLGITLAQAGGLQIELMRVRVKKPIAKPQLRSKPVGAPDAAHARTGSRAVGWGSRSGEAQVYLWESLEPGNRVTGCALLEGLQTTYLVPEGWTLEVDRFGNATMERS